MKFRILCVSRECWIALNKADPAQTCKADGLAEVNQETPLKLVSTCFSSMSSYRFRAASVLIGLLLAFLGVGIGR